MKSKLNIDIVSDLVCPWCVIGYLRLNKALAQLPEDIYPAIKWHPFQLNPSLPEAGQNLNQHVADTYATSAKQSADNRARIVELGAEEGFDFHFFDDMYIYNTHKVHKLMVWAQDYAQQTDLALALYKAYFQQQKALNDEQVLLDIIAAVGLNPDLAQCVLVDKHYDEQVDAQQRHWREQGIDSVPAFVLNRKFFVRGAQSGDTFNEAVEKSVSELRKGINNEEKSS